MSVTGFLVDGQVQKYDYGSLDNLPDIPENSGTFWAIYNSTSEAEITDAFSNNKSVMMKIGNDVFYVMRKLSIGPSGSAWLFVNVGNTNIRTTWVSGSYWNTFSTNAIGGEISNNLKQALLQLASKVAYIDEYGQRYYNDLYNALYPHELMSISATFNQGSNIIYDIDPLTVLNQYLTVVANYLDGTTETISSSNYTLSGNLLEGVSTITVYYDGFTDTFDVNVTHMAGYYTIVNNLTGCTTNNSATAIQENTSYTAIITASAGYTLSGATVTITMGGNILTGVFSNGTISIPNVTGDLVITVVASALTLSSISAVYTQSGTVYDTDTLDSLKADLVVTALYSDSSTQTVPAADYTLSGTLTAGTSTITVSYGGKATTFSVTVSEAPLLPTEYQQVEYIKATGTQHIITDLMVETANNTTSNSIRLYTADIDFQFDEWQSSYATNIMAGFGATAGLWIGYANAVTNIAMGTSSGNYFSGDPTTRHQYHYAVSGLNGVWTREDSASISRASSGSGERHFDLFYLEVTSGTQNNFHFNGKLYSCKVFKSGVAVLDLYPCYRKADGVIGLYDTVNNRFYTNNGSGTFLKGADVT